jgi:hypothetical protein
MVTTSLFFAVTRYFFPFSIYVPAKRLTALHLIPVNQQRERY